MQIYVDCLFRLARGYINLNDVHPRLLFCLERDNAVVPVTSLQALRSGVPIKLTRGAFQGAAAFPFP